MRKKTVTLDLSSIADAIDTRMVNGTRDLEAAIAGETTRTITATGDQMADLLVKNCRKVVAEQRSFKRRFEARLRQTWDPALWFFDLVQTLSLEFGSQLNAEFRPGAVRRDDFIFEALTRLHGRACLTASEIGALLRSGHATGANTRWRTLNELAVVSFFISERGKDVAKRFLDHQIVEAHFGAKRYREFTDRLNLDPLDEAEFEELHRSVRELTERYGQSFDQPYGWAAASLGVKRPTFTAISRSINMEHFAPYVHMASHGVHSGARGAYFDLGLPESVSDAIPASPSHFGLADPGQAALISLGQVTAALFFHCLNLGIEAMAESDNQMRCLIRNLLMCAEMHALNKLVDRGANLFVEIGNGMDESSAWSSSPPEIFDRSRWRT